MEEQLLRILIPATGLVSGLIGAFVGLQNRALLAEVRKEIAELENRIITRINGTYVRSGECQLAGRPLSTNVSTAIAEEMKNRTAAGDCKTGGGYEGDLGDAVGARSILPFEALDLEAHLLGEAAGDEAADAVRLPAGGVHESLRDAPSGRLSISSTIAFLLPSRPWAARRWWWRPWPPWSSSARRGPPGARVRASGLGWPSRSG